MDSQTSHVKYKSQLYQHINHYNAPISSPYTPHQEREGVSSFFPI